MSLRGNQSVSRAPAELAEEEDVVVDKEVEDEEEECEDEDEDKEDEDEEEEGRERGLEVPPASVGRAMGGEGRTIHSQAAPLVRPVDAGHHYTLKGSSYVHFMLPKALQNI